MAENSGDLSLGYMMGQSDSGGSNGGFGGMFGEGLWAIIILAMLGFGGGYGFGGGFGGGVGLNGALTRAELYDGFAIQNIDSAVRNVQNGIADSTYALTGAITGGFHGVDRAVCDLSHQISDCCCNTQRAIDGVNYNMATQFCSLGNTIQSTARDVIDNQNANYRGIMDFLVQEKLSSKDAEIAQLQNQVSQANQNAVIGARIDAAVAELLRRTGNDCPTAAYLVQPPTAVNFPTNGCGTVQFNGWGGNCGCGC